LGNRNITVLAQEILKQNGLVSGWSEIDLGAS